LKRQCEILFIRFFNIILNQINIGVIINKIMNKTFKNLKNQIDKADSSVSDLLKIYSKTSSDLKKANQIIEDLSKKLLVSENAIHNTKKQVESLIDLVKKN